MRYQSHKFKAILKSCRPRQWTKNFIVAAAPLFSLKFDLGILYTTIISFICFCLISSSIYLLNDSLDINEDKIHPIKKYRPIPSGLISVQLAKLTSFSLIFISLLISAFVSKALFLILIGYLIIQLSYCLIFKNKPILDLICISSGFLLRSIAGGAASGIFISPWFLLSLGFLALFLAVEKRKAELVQYENNGELTRKVLKRYSMPLLLRIENLSSTSALITYSLWASGPSLQGAPSSGLIFTVPFVLLGILRYQLLSDPEEIKRNTQKDITFSSQNPEEILIKDPGMKIIIFIWLLTTLLIII